MSECLVKQGAHQCVHVIEFKLQFSKNDACRCEDLYPWRRCLSQEYSINKKTYTLEAHGDVGVEELLCSLQLLCVVLEQLPQRKGELIFRLLVVNLKQSCFWEV